MAALDKLMVLIGANASEFNSVMDGVAAKTEQTQSTFGKISDAGISAGANLAKGFAVAASAAVGFGAAVKKLRPLLKEYGTLVDDSTTRAFREMDEAMDRAGRTMGITLAGAMKGAAGGFIILVEKLTATATETGVLKNLMVGLGYVFAVVGVSIEKLALVISVTSDAFRIIGKSIQQAYNSLQDWTNGTDEATDANAALDGEIDALTASRQTDVDKIFDFSAYGKAIEDAQQRTIAFNNTPIGSESASKPTWMSVYEKGLQDLRAKTDETSQGMAAQLAAANDLQYENELRNSQLRLALLNAEVEQRVWAHNKTLELEVLKTGIINDNLKEQESAKASFDANWQSSEQFRLEFLSGVLSNMATLMQTGNKKLFTVGKVFAIGQALIDTYRGISASLALGFPLGWIAAAATAVAGFANVMKIKNTQYGGGGGGGTSVPAKPDVSSAPAAPTTSSGGGAQSTNVNVTLIGESFGQGAVRGLIGQINGATGDNVRLNVNGRT